jgi:ABC-type uncharacterized transport system substrate-binding protein
MDKNRITKTIAAIGLIGGSLMLFLSLVMLCGCPRNPQGAGVAFSDTVTPCEKESYKKVFVVHSYLYDHTWVQSITRGIRMELDSQEADVQFIYMDTMNHPDKETMIQKGDEALAVIGQWLPDVVITCDDNAQEYVGKKLAKEGKIPVVFCGVNMNPSQYGYPAANVTGVLERPHFSETVSLLKKLLGKNESPRLLVMLDCNENTNYIFDSMKQQVTPQESELLERSAPRTFEEWKETVQNAQSKVDAIAVYLCYPVPQEPNGVHVLTSLEVLAWTTQNSRIPIVGFLPSVAKTDCLCGVLESGLEQGKIAGQMARKILQGAKPASLEIQTSQTGQPLLNLDMARKLGIDVSDEIIGQVDILVGTGDKQSSI